MSNGAQGNVIALAGEAADFVNNLYGLCFGDSIDLVTRAVRISGHTKEEIDLMEPSAILEIFKDKTARVQAACAAFEIDPSVPKETKLRIFTFARRIVRALVNMDKFLCANQELHKACMAATLEATVSDADASWRYAFEVPEGPGHRENPTQKLYDLVFKEAKRLGFARYKDSFMQRIVTPEGMITNAWRKRCTITEFIYSLSETPDSEVLRLLKTSPGVTEGVAKLMSCLREPIVPWLKLDRTVFAFKNGTYLADKETFVLYSAGAPPSTPDGKACPTACKYHDVVIDPAWLQCDDWKDIPTPLMDHIMDTQELSPDVKRVYYAMLGRAVFEIGAMDNWQIVLFVKGMAGTGKSTLLDFVSNWYNSTDIGILSNGIEEKFGASMLADKLLIIADDIGENFTMDQQLFQKMVSGNPVSLPEKNRTALVLERGWKTPMLFSGNVLPDYKDNSGSYARRILMILYNIIVTHIDPTISDRLMKNEVGAAIIKCVRAYLNMVRRYNELASNGTDFWHALPEEFRIQKNNLQQSANAMMNFLYSTKIIYGKSLYMPFDVFAKQAQEHWTSMGINRQRLSPSNYEGPFSIVGISVVNRGKREWPAKSGLLLETKWINGCDMMTNGAIQTATQDMINLAQGVVTEFAGQKRTAQDDAPMGGATPVTVRRPLRASPRPRDQGQHQQGAPIAMGHTSSSSSATRPDPTLAQPARKRTF